MNAINNAYMESHVSIFLTIYLYDKNKQNIFK